MSHGCTKELCLVTHTHMAWYSVGNDMHEENK